MKHQLHVFPGFGTGGSQRRFVQLYKALPEWKHTVISLSDDISAAGLCDDTNRLDVRTLKLRKSRGVSGGNVLKLSDLIKEFSPDLLCTYNWGSMEAVFANRTGSRLPHIHFEDGFGPDEMDRRKKKRNMVRRFALRGDSITVLPSHTLSEIALKEWHLQERKFRYIPNGVDTDKYLPRTELPEKGPILVGTVAALRKEKNLARMLRVISKSSGNYCVCIAGDGEERPLLEKQAENLDQEVSFRGNLSDTSSFYRQIDVFMLTSDTEQMPLTVLEAMASSLPVVATDVGDVRRMVSEDNQPYILQAEDERGLSSALDDLMKNRSRREKIGRANRAKVLQLYSQQNMFAAYQQLFEEALHTR